MRNWTLEFTFRYNTGPCIYYYLNHNTSNALKPSWILEYPPFNLKFSQNVSLSRTILQTHLPPRPTHPQLPFRKMGAPRIHSQHRRTSPTTPQTLNKLARRHRINPKPPPLLALSHGPLLYPKNLYLPPRRPTQLLPENRNRVLPLRKKNWAFRDYRSTWR